jgi:hypothetical protein
MSQTKMEDLRKNFPYQFGIVATMLDGLKKERNILGLYEMTREKIRQGNVHNVLRVPGLLEFWDYAAVLYEEGFLETRLTDSMRDRFLSDAIAKGYNIPDGEKGIQHKEKIRYVVQEISKWSETYLKTRKKSWFLHS